MTQQIIEGAVRRTVQEPCELGKLEEISVLKGRTRGRSWVAWVNASWTRSLASPRAGVPMATLSQVRFHEEQAPSSGDGAPRPI
jgi:hypothetical protein